MWELPLSSWRNSVSIEMNYWDLILIFLIEFYISWWSTEPMSHSLAQQFDPRWSSLHTMSQEHVSWRDMWGKTSLGKRIIQPTEMRRKSMRSHISSFRCCPLWLSSACQSWPQLPVRGMVDVDWRSWCRWASDGAESKSVDYPQLGPLRYGYPFVWVDETIQVFDLNLQLIS